MYENAKPSIPSLAVSEMKLEETEVAASTACEVAVTLPTTTLSEYTVPLAPEPSPYSMSHVYFDFSFPDFLGS